MDEQIQKPKKERLMYSANNGGGLVWVLGVIGAAVYYIQQAQSFQDGALGILKALVWPAILVYKLLGL